MLFYLTLNNLITIDDSTSKALNDIQKLESLLKDYLNRPSAILNLNRDLRENVAFPEEEMIEIITSSKLNVKTENEEKIEEKNKKSNFLKFFMIILLIIKKIDIFYFFLDCDTILRERNIESQYIFSTFLGKKKSKLRLKKASSRVFNCDSLMKKIKAYL